MRYVLIGILSLLHKLDELFLQTLPKKILYHSFLRFEFQSDQRNTGGEALKNASATLSDVITSIAVGLFNLASSTFRSIMVTHLIIYSKIRIENIISTD